MRQARRIFRIAVFLYFLDYLLRALRISTPLDDAKTAAGAIGCRHRCTGLQLRTPIRRAVIGSTPRHMRYFQACSPRAGAARTRISHKPMAAEGIPPLIWHDAFQPRRATVCHEIRPPERGNFFFAGAQQPPRSSAIRMAAGKFAACLRASPLSEMFLASFYSSTLHHHAITPPRTHSRFSSVAHTSDKKTDLLSG